MMKKKTASKVRQNDEKKLEEQTKLFDNIIKLKGNKK